MAPPPLFCRKGVRYGKILFSMWSPYSFLPEYPFLAVVWVIYCTLSWQLILFTPSSKRFKWGKLRNNSVFRCADPRGFLPSTLLWQVVWVYCTLSFGSPCPLPPALRQKPLQRVGKSARKSVKKKKLATKLENPQKTHRKLPNRSRGNNFPFLWPKEHGSTVHQADWSNKTSQSLRQVNLHRKNRRQNHSRLELGCSRHGGVKETEYGFTHTHIYTYEVLRKARN